MRTMPSVAAKPLTWDDIKDWPEDAGSKTELVHGELVMSPAANLDHAYMSNVLGFALNLHISEFNLGRLYSSPVDVILAPEAVFQPDLCYVRTERRHILHDRILGPPDLCIEIISESNRTHDTVVKFKEYARYGVAEYWLVDGRGREISSWRNVDDQFELIGRARAGDRVRSLVLPELELDPAKVFASLLR